MKLTKPRKRITRTEYFRQFDRITSPGSGFSFSCAPNGKVNVGKLTPLANDNFQMALNRSDLYDDKGVVTCTSSYWEPGTGRCDTCGQTVYISDAFTSACDHCGTEYNGSGQRLAPRRFWGEETGEYF